MKFVSYINEHQQERLGLYHNGKTYGVAECGRKLSMELPSTMSEFLLDTETYLPLIQQVQKALNQEGELKPDSVFMPLAPVPHPTSCRDGYAFRQHVEKLRKNRGADMIPEFDQFPVFYFTNHNAILGEGVFQVQADHLDKLDFELELAIVLGKAGRNIEAKDADGYILGYTIMNDFSARTLQMEEMKLNLGPAKGKDFGTSIGPWLVTCDELEKFCRPTAEGNRYDLQMRAFHNGRMISEGNASSMNWTFAQIIERASYGVDVYPGDVIGSGTVGTGCYAELNSTAALEAEKKGESFTPTWLEDGDTIDLEIQGLGKLSNTIQRVDSPYSLFEKKKPA